MEDTGDLRLLELDMATMFAMTASGRIERNSQPDGAPGPRFCLLGCAAGNIARVRHDLADDIAARVLAIAAQAPPWSDPDTAPPWLDEIVELLSRQAPVEQVGRGAVFSLPNRIKLQADTLFLRSDTPEAGRMLGQIVDDGMPQALVDAGFLTIDDFWAPWSVALEYGEIAAIAFAARLGGAGAEVGVYTFPAFRGQGFAAAVTADWTSMKDLADRALFYSAEADNRSSRRVAERLGLRRIGASVRVG